MGVSLLALIGPNGLYVELEVCLVKLQMRADSLCLLPAEEECEAVSLGEMKTRRNHGGCNFLRVVCTFARRERKKKFRDSALK